MANKPTVSEWTVTARTQSWLGNWFSGGAEVPNPTSDVVAELNVYCPLTVITLYRAEVTHNVQTFGLLTYNNPSSWTYDLNVATRLSAGRNSPVITTTVHPNQVLVDSTLLPHTFMKRFFPEEVEVILLPGIYYTEAVDPHVT